MDRYRNDIEIEKRCYECDNIVVEHQYCCDLCLNYPLCNRCVEVRDSENICMCCKGLNGQYG